MSSTFSVVAEETKACPWCAETILAAAKKCKHCGEYLSDERPAAASTPTASVIPARAPAVVARTGKQGGIVQNGWEWREQSQMWLCVKHHQSPCYACPAKPKEPPSGVKRAASRAIVVQARTSPSEYTGAMGTRQPLSQAGAHTSEGVLKCPKCGGTEFTAKRSNKSKAAGAAVGLYTLGVGAAVVGLAPKSQVKCVACGLKFKRG